MPTIDFEKAVGFLCVCARAGPGNNLEQSLESDEVQRYLDLVLEATYKNRHVALRKPEIMR